MKTKKWIMFIAGSFPWQCSKDPQKHIWRQEIKNNGYKWRQNLPFCAEWGHYIKTDTFFNRNIADLLSSQLLIYWKNQGLILSLSLEKLLACL